METSTSQGRGLFRWYHGWNIIVVCLLSQVAALGLPTNSFTMFLKPWKEELHAPISQLALCQTLMALICAFIGPLVGYVSDRKPARLLFGCGLIGLALVYAAISRVTSLAQLLALYVIPLPFVMSFAATVPAQCLITRWFTHRKGLALGLGALGITLSGVIMPLLISFLMPTLGWRGIWLYGAIIVGVFVFPLVVLVAREKPAGPQSLAPATPPEAAAKVGYREIFRNRNLWILVGSFVPILMVASGTLYNLAPIALSYGMDLRSVGLLLTGFSVLGLLAKLAAGVLADRFGAKPPLLTAALAATLGALVLCFSAGQPTLLVAGVGVMALSAGVWTLMAVVTASEFGPAGFGRAFGILSLFTPLGSLASPVVARVEEQTGTYSTSFAALVGLGLVSTVMALFLGQPPRRLAGAPTPTLVAPDAASR